MYYAHLAQQLERVLRHEGLLATLIHCVSAQCFQREPNRKGLSRIADIVLHAALQVVKATSLAAKFTSVALLWMLGCAHAVQSQHRTSLYEVKERARLQHTL